MVFMKDTQYIINQSIINDPDPNTILVVGILFNVEGDTINSFIDKLQVGTFKPVDNLDLSPFVNPTKNYFHYSGGLTTPPCLETVNWVVMKKIETMTRAQFDGFKNLILPLYPYGNYRTTKPLYNRTIYYVENSNGGNYGQISLLFIALIFSILLH
jgi:carbonic anhydrase